MKRTFNAGRQTDNHDIEKYTVSFYSNSGNKIINMNAATIDFDRVSANTYEIKDMLEYKQVLSSVTTMIINGKEIDNCGNTVIVEEDGLLPDVNFRRSSTFNNNMEKGVVNRYKDYFKKQNVVVIHDQLGNPLYAYSGNNIDYEVFLPKTTKLMIDGKALYIHRANFQIIDKELLD